MHLDIEPVKKWFGYNRKERRASFILIILIIIVLSARVFVPSSDMEITDVTLQFMSEADADSVKHKPSFMFDPNKASYDTLLLAGLEEKEARTLVSYRNKGGRFRKPSDIQKLHGLDSAEAERIIPYISIRQDTSYNIRYQKRAPVGLNSCDSAMLEKLPGIGPVLSARIIKYRNLLGGFVAVDQLREVYGLQPETYETIRTMVFADTALVKKVNINDSDYSGMSRIPYLRRFQVSNILKYRELHGKITGVEELVRNNIIPDSIAGKIRAYLLF